MDRVIGDKPWSLIPYINQRVPDRHKVVQKHYIFKASNTFRRYNDITSLIQDPASASARRYDVPLFNATFDVLSASQVWADQVKTMTDALSADFDAGFNLLMEYDSLSVRQFLLKKGFTNNEIDWMETVNDATGHYDTYSMSQAVMEEWIFYSADANNWTMINGGMDMLTKGMTHIIKNKPVLNHRVTNINKNSDKSLKIVINDTEEYDYAHVISTVPMGALQIINMTELDLGYYQKTAFRTLK
jgi:hypothetical protein